MFESVVVQFVMNPRKPLGKCLMERMFREKQKIQERFDK